MALVPARPAPPARPVRLRRPPAAVRRAPLELVVLGPSHVPALTRYFDALSDQARAFRFLQATSQVSPAGVRVLCRPDGERHLAWAAVRGGVIVGECQLARCAAVGHSGPWPATAGCAEFALSVAEGSRGEGIGRFLLAAAAAAAARRGIGTLAFTADAGNARMLAWMAARGGRWTTHAGVATGWLRTPAPASDLVLVPGLGPAGPAAPSGPWAAARRRWAATLRARAPRLA